MKSPSRAFWCAAVATAALGGCATRYSPRALESGATVNDVTASMGAPTGRYAMAGGGQRVEYARGPYGKHTYMLDFDSQGRLTSWQQVLDEPRFNDIRTGMSRDELLQTIGHPSDTRQIAHQQRTLWSYRYESPFCKWFQVGLDRQDKVVDTGYGPDPMCDVNFSNR
jgi:hypothetical protein